MRENHETKKRFQYSLKGAMLLAILAAIVISAINQYRLTRKRKQLEGEVASLTTENEELEYKLLLQRLAGNLKVPTPALYHRYLPVLELHRLRVNALRAAGVERCPPITALQSHSMDHADVSFLLSRNIYRIDDGSVSIGTFWEGHAKTRGGNGALALSAYLRGTPAFRDWLVDQHELLREYVRPLLLRIAKAPDPWARYHAIEALLLLGDHERSHDILHILRDSIRRPEEEPPGLSEFERLRFHDVDPVRAMDLIEQFDLSAAIDEK